MRNGLETGRGFRRSSEHLWEEIQNLTAFDGMGVRRGRVLGCGGLRIRKWRVAAMGGEGMRD